MFIYTIYDHRNNPHLLTAKRLYKRVLEDSRYDDYNWIAPASELVRVCKWPSFPVIYAQGIKCSILNCYANNLRRKNCGLDSWINTRTENEAIQECYNSLYGFEAEEVVSARKRYLTLMITTDCIRPSSFAPLYHSGPTFSKIKEEWIHSKVEEYISQKEIDFEELVEVLHDEFEELIRKAESEGAFEEDEKAEIEYWKRFYEKHEGIGL